MRYFGSFSSFFLVKPSTQKAANSKRPPPHDEAQPFYKTYYINILEHVFFVTTSILHARANLKEHSKLLAGMIKTVCSNRIVKGEQKLCISWTLAPDDVIAQNNENQNNQKYVYWIFICEKVFFEFWPRIFNLAALKFKKNFLSARITTFTTCCSSNSVVK